MTSQAFNTRSRTVERIGRGVPTSDGAGVKLTRVLTQDLQQRLDPFLMLDAFGSDKRDEYIAGFPDHPVRLIAGSPGIPLPCVKYETGSRPRSISRESPPSEVVLYGPVARTGAQRTSSSAKSGSLTRR